LRRFRFRTSFANVWQIHGIFAEVWQNPKTARRAILPMFGKMRAFLPDIGNGPDALSASPAFLFPLASVPP
jgi:hypothetical protein